MGTALAVDALSSSKLSAVSANDIESSSVEPHDMAGNFTGRARIACQGGNAGPSSSQRPLNFLFFVGMLLRLAAARRVRSSETVHGLHFFACGARR